jgi:hypothetical protein
MRCGTCKNCKELAKVQRSVLRAVNPPFSHADDAVVDVWNTELERLPCLKEKTDGPER